MDYKPSVISYYPTNSQSSGHKSEATGDDYVDNTERTEAFEDMGLRPEVLRGIYAYGLEYPSYIQERAIVPIIRGRDIIMQGKSGTGKTAAVIIGVLQKIRPEIDCIQAIIIEPTHELAIQTKQTIDIVGQYMRINCEVFIGGRYFDEDQVVYGCHVGVATVGRLKHMLKIGALPTDFLQVLVLDEFDELLQKENDRKQMEDILCKINSINQFQFVLSSATTNDHILNAAECITKDPIRILLRRQELGLLWIKQYFAIAETREAKLKKLLDYLSNVDICGQLIIFCNRKPTVDWLIVCLERRNYNPIHLHANMTQDRREDTMRKFIENRSQMMITSDVLSRGIDIQQISDVINFDFPKSFGTYIHRIARSGRRGREGTALTLFEPSETKFIPHIERLYNVKMEELVIDSCLPSYEWINLFLAAIITMTEESVINWSKIANIMETRMPIQKRMDAKRCEHIFYRLVGRYIDVLSEAKTTTEASELFVHFETMNKIDVIRVGISHRVAKQLSESWTILIDNDGFYNPRKRSQIRGWDSDSYQDKKPKIH